MRHGFVITVSDPRQVVDLAVEIETAGWDAAFTWETIYFADPWVLLGAMAVRTERILLGPLLTPPSRRRPWKLAGEVATVDRLSDGRALLAVGVGAPDTGFAEVGEAVDRRQRVELMDECLELLDRFWSGDPFTFTGSHYTVDWTKDRGEPFRPVQRPRPPIWSVTQLDAPGSEARAFRWDGALPYKRTVDNPYAPLAPDDVRSLARRAADARGDRPPLEIAIEGRTPTGDGAARERVQALAEAGATWWIESMWETPGGIDALRERIAAGPVRW